jgi:hypothetical protein
MAVETGEIEFGNVTWGSQMQRAHLAAQTER